MPLRLGITDGQMTEVLAGTLTEGQAVVVGIAPSGAKIDAAGAPFRFRLL